MRIPKIKGTRNVGRPTTTWHRMIEKERCKDLGWKSWEEACKVIANWEEWKRLAEALCTT